MELTQETIRSPRRWIADKSLACNHAASGCNYPEGECVGLCHKPATWSIAQANQVYKVWRINPKRLNNFSV